MRDQLAESLRRRIPDVFSRFSRPEGALSVFQARCAVLELTGEELSRAEIRSLAGPDEPITLDVLTRIMESVLGRVAGEALSFETIYELIDTRRRGYITAEDLHTVS